MADAFAPNRSHPKIYGLDHPTLDDLHSALLTVAGERAETTWADLLRAAGVTVGHDDPAATRRLVDAMCTGPDPVIALCGRAQRIRMVSYERLMAVQRSAPVR